MSEEVLETENIDPTESQEGELEAGSGLSEEEKDALIAKLRKEAAGRRVSNKEKDAQLKEYADWKLSQMTEVERAKAEKAELQSELKALREENWRDKAAQKAGLDPDFADRVLGETYEEMFADAKRLAAALGKTTPRTASDALAGKRGKPVGGSATMTEDEWLRSELLK